MSELTHGALFNGIAGFPLAAQWAGIKTVWTCEIDPFCNAVSAKHFPNAKQYKNIYDLKNPEYVDIISGGFPCQDISISQQSKGGAKGIKGERSGLWKEYARIVREIKPKYIIFENSPMLAIRGFEQILCDLAEIGYDAEWTNFFSTQWGFKDYRERIYGVAYPMQLGCQNNINKNRILSKILPERSSRQIALPMSFKRYGRKSDLSDILLDSGLSRRLDKRIIHAYGNAIKPQIAFEIFKAIKEIHE